MINLLTFPPLVLMLSAIPVPCNPFPLPLSIRASVRHKNYRLNDWGPSTILSPTGPLFVSDEKRQGEKDNVQLAIDAFISTLLLSLDDGSFESFTLKGPSAPRKRRKKKGNNNSDDDDAMLEQQKEKLRGKYKTISGRLLLLQEKKKRKRTSRGRDRRAPLKDKGNDAGVLHVQTTIKYHLATDLAKNWKVNKLPESEPNEVEEGLRQLFLTAMGNDVDGQSGAPLSEWGAKNINGELGILSGELSTSNGTYNLQLQPGHKAGFRLSKKKGSQNDTGASKGVNDLSHLSHDRTKNVPLSPSSEFFQKLGVTSADGKPVNGMASKLRQCQKFVETVGNLVDNTLSASSGFQAERPRIRVIDMGCGRGYLTFSLHSYLSNKFGAMHDGTSVVETQGIDRRPKLIEEINGIARDLGDHFSTLNFISGTIGETHNSLFGDDKLNQNAEDLNSLDILIALHACDCATDDAIWFAINRGADIIVTAPCCQHELRPQIDSHASNNPMHPLGEVLRHAIYRERATETVTDAMRSILLEIAGYTTQVFEFISGKHTAKNVMITATKVKRQRSDSEQNEFIKERRQRLVDLAQLYGIKRQRLAKLMGERIQDDCNDSKRVKMNMSGMAPL